MECQRTREWLLADDGIGSSDRPPEIGQHLTECSECAGFERRLRQMEQGWRELPIPSSVDADREAFLRRVRERSPAAPSRLLPAFHRRVLARFSIVAAALAALFVWTVRLPQADASGDIIDRLVEWNVEISQQRRLDDRQQIYDRQARQLEADLRRSELSPEDGALARSLLENGSWLCQNDDPLAESDRFGELADRFVLAMKKTVGASDAVTTKRRLKAYERLTSVGVDTPLGKILAAPALNFDQITKLERAILKDASRIGAIAEFLEKTPDASRAQIKEMLERHKRRTEDLNQIRRRKAERDARP